jgi:hypothetical protein
VNSLRGPTSLESGPHRSIYGRHAFGRGLWVWLHSNRFNVVDRTRLPSRRQFVELRLVGEGGLEPLLLPAEMASELQVHSESFPLSPARYLRFRSRALTASRAVTNFHARTAGQRVSNREAPEVRPCASWWCLLQH